MANWTDAVAAEEFQDGASHLVRRDGHSRRIEVDLAPPAA
jgi:hypothetical protein